MNEEKPIIAERIKLLRKEKGYTQEQLADLLGLNAKSSIANYESGANAPSDEIKAKICELFNCTMDYLMGNSEFKTKREEYKYYKLLESKTEASELIQDTLEELFLVGLNKNQILQLIDIVSASGLENINERKNKKKQLDNLYNSFPSEQRKIVKQVIENFIRKLLLKQKSKLENKIFTIPVLGKITAGQPILAEEYLEGYLPVDPNIYGMTTPDDYFYLKVSGESMNLKVHNGDYALIHKQDYAENGDIIVAIINGFDEATLKRYKKLSDELVMLEPMSTYPMEPIVINLKETKFQIIGKAIGQFGKF